MQPDPSYLLKKTKIRYPLIGFYDAPSIESFEPTMMPRESTGACVFAFFKKWLNGKTLLITKDHFGCGGAGNWLCGVKGRSRKEYVEFLVDEEGLKETHELMDQWLEHQKSYAQEHPNILIGPLKEENYDFLKTITFFVNPDQLSILLIGAQYHCKPDEPFPVIAPFGSGCMLLATLFEDFKKPQAIVGATDIAMRQYLPREILAFTVTKPMFERLCQLDKSSFLNKSFIKTLHKSRKKKN